MSEHCVAALAARVSSGAWHGEIKVRLQSECSLGTDEHPSSLAKAFEILNNHDLTKRPKFYALMNTTSIAKYSDLSFF